MAKEIDYRPQIEFTPDTGQDQRPPGALAFSEDDYASRPYALEQLARLIQQGEDILETLRQRLSRKALVVVDGSNESVLLEAIATEWPKQLQNPNPKKVPFHFYLQLLPRATASSNYITERVERLARDITANSDLDAFVLTSIVVDEAKQYFAFLSESVTKTDSPFQKRLIENAQEYGVDGQRLLEILWKGFNTLYATDHGDYSPEETTKNLALLKLKANEVNKSVSGKISDLRIQIQKTSSQFWGKIVPGAYKTTMKAVPGFRRKRTELDRIVDSIIKETEIKHQDILVDQFRRVNFIEQRGKEIVEDIKRLHVLRSYHARLVDQSGFVPKSAVLWTDEVTTADELNAFSTTELEPKIFSAPHSNTTDLESDDHQQYLRADGGRVITGDIKLADGVRVDGLLIGKHSHTGEEDQGEKVSGQSIEEGTLTPEAVDKQALPDKPDNLNVVQQTTNVQPDGQRNTNIELDWEGSQEHSYQVQMVPSTIVAGSVINKPRLYEAIRSTSKDGITKTFLGEGQKSASSQFLGRVRGKVIFPFQKTTDALDEIWLAVAQQGSLSDWKEFRLVSSETSLRSASVVLRPDGNGWVSYYQLTSPLVSNPLSTGYTRRMYLVLSETKWLINTSAPIIEEEVAVNDILKDEPPQMFTAYNRQQDKCILGTFGSPIDSTDNDKLRSIDRTRTVTDIDIGDSLGGTSAGHPIYTASYGANTHILYTTGTNTDYVAQHLKVDTASDTAEIITGPYGGGLVRWVACNVDRSGQLHAIVWPPGSAEEFKGADFEHWIYNGTAWELEFIFSEGY